MDDVLKDRLGDFQSNWEVGKDAKPEDNRIPPGQYRMALQSVELTESMSSGKLLIRREHVVIDGEYLGHTVRDFISMESDFGPRMTAQFIQQMGFNVPDRVDALPDVLAAITEAAPKYLARVKHSGDFINVYIGKLLDVGSAPATAPAPKAAAPTSAPAATQAPRQAPKPAAPPPQAAPAAEPPSSGGDDRYDELVAFCQEYGVPVTDGDSTDQIIEKLKTYDWAAAQGMAPEAADLLAAVGVLEGHNVDVVEEAAPVEGDGGLTVGSDVACELADGNAYPGTVTAINGDNVTVTFEDGSVLEMDASFVALRTSDALDKAFTELVEFCQAQNVDIEATDTLEVLAAKVAGYEWDKAKLTPSEVELLTNLPGVEITWVKPAPKAAPKPAPKPAPAPKAPAKPAAASKPAPKAKAAPAKAPARKK